jgi:hypothetical protein
MLSVLFQRWRHIRLLRQVRRLRRLAWGDVETRRDLQRHGVDVLPSNFYSSTPSVEEIEGSFEYAPSPSPPYLDERLFDHDRLTAHLHELSAYAGELSPPEEGNERNPSTFFWRNGQFSHSDAMAYYCMVRHLRPPTIVEVGGGFSTLVAVEALRRNGAGRLVCVEPFPQPFLARLPGVELIRAKAQALDAAAFGDLLADGSFLVIDSTHTVKTGSDCVHLYLRVLPRLDRELVVHAHDVFLPFGLPQEWLLHRQISWTEQYLLLALLTDNPRAELLFGSAYHLDRNPELLTGLMGGKFPAGGGSFWFRYGKRPASAPR